MTHAALEPCRESPPRTPRLLTRWIPLSMGVLVAAGALAASGHAEPEAAAPSRDWVRTVVSLDAAVEAKWKEAGVTAAVPADDAEFLRRVTLDLVGRIPTAEEAALFLKDEAADKRTKRVDELLASPQYGEFWGHLW